MVVRVSVEYCGVCNFQSQCEMLRNFLQLHKPDAEVVCQVGRSGAFEVKIDDTLVHSKLQCLAFPDFESVLENVNKAEQNLPMGKVKEQPIKDCAIM